MDLYLILTDDLGNEIGHRAIYVDGIRPLGIAQRAVNGLGELLQEQIPLAPCLLCDQPFIQGAARPSRTPVPFRGGFAHQGCHDDHTNALLEGLEVDQ